MESLWILAVLHTCLAVSKADSSPILNTFRIYFSLRETESNKLNGKEDFMAMHQLTVKCRNCFLEFAPVCDNLRQLSAPTVTSLYQWLQLPPRFSFTQPEKFEWTKWCFPFWQTLTYISYELFFCVSKLLPTVPQFRCPSNFSTDSAVTMTWSVISVKKTFPCKIVYLW